MWRCRVEFGKSTVYNGKSGNFTILLHGTPIYSRYAMIRVKKLDHFGLDVSDLEAAEKFYTEVLEMRVQMRLRDQVLLRFGDTNLALFLNPNMKKDKEKIQNPLGRSHHALEVSWEHYQVALKKFPESGIPSNGPIDWGDHECIYFLDPDCNLLELVSYRK